MKYLIIVFFLFFSQNGFSQSAEPNEKYKFFDSRPNKGKIFGSFGWNRAVFSNSKIHFKGNDHDFVLSNVKATDRQTPFSFEIYFGPSTFTIPQVNFKIGYFFNEHFNVSFNIDHMKYVMVQDQKAKISGTINLASSVYNGIYSDSLITLSEDFLTFEHTNGLNYISIEVNRFDNVLEWIKLKNKWIDVNLQEGLAFGLITPKTDATLLGKNRNDEFYLSGYGISGTAGINLRFFQYLFFEYNLKGGFIDLPIVKTTNFSSDNAKQNFWFFQNIYSFGFNIKISK